MCKVSGGNADCCPVAVFTAIGAVFITSIALNILLKNGKLIQNPTYTQLKALEATFTVTTILSGFITMFVLSSLCKEKC